MTIDVLELARANGIHLLCLPAHTTHILQPLDVGVSNLLSPTSPKPAIRTLWSILAARVITTDVLAFLVAEAWPHSLTPLNIMGGFKKCGIYPINLGAVSNRQLAPSKALCPLKVQPTCNPDVAMSGDPPSTPGSPPFTSEQEALYERRFEEGYNLLDPSYIRRGLRLLILKWLSVLTVQKQPHWFWNTNSKRFGRLSTVCCLIKVCRFRWRKLFVRCPELVACPTWASEVKTKTEKETST